LYVVIALVSMAINEFQSIENLRSKYSLGKLGDDCAILPKDADTDLLVTADLLVEDIDFRLNWTKPEFLGHKALAVSLSDVAAMGGTPKWAMLSLGIPENLWNTGFIDQFYEGWFALAKKFDVELVGGDISRSPDRLLIDSIAGGEVPKGKAILRSGAKPGDAIYVTGSLGGAAGGLKLLEQGVMIDSNSLESQDHLMLSQLKPSPQLTIANLLQSLDITTAMIDISDGLSSDLSHICRESGVGARIYADTLPIHDDLRDFFSPDACLEIALHGGEDFELLFIAPPQKNGSVPGTRIGEITSETGNIYLVKDDNIEILHPKGYKHF
jgi:thiamine-monophosphate kinase